MRLWLNGREPAYMNDDEPGCLSREQIAHATNCLTYEGLQYLAALFFVWMNTSGFSPQQIMAIADGKEIKSACADK